MLIRYFHHVPRPILIFFSQKRCPVIASLNYIKANKFNYLLYRFLSYLEYVAQKFTSLIRRIDELGSGVDKSSNSSKSSAVLEMLILGAFEMSVLNINLRDIGINSLRSVRRIIIVSIGHVSLVEGVLELIDVEMVIMMGFESSNKNKNMKNTIYYYYRYPSNCTLIMGLPLFHNAISVYNIPFMTVVHCYRRISMEMTSYQELSIDILTELLHQQ
uniref:Uncharacterized protein n=1 Tax=Rhizophagus irregularis (strain DAOM 181602 / DAOM 197198 / MUCL 43194) TaxID=747089 RepID=U9UR40_RHIID